MNTWQLEIKKNGRVQTLEGLISMSQLATLRKDLQSEPARVGMTVGRSLEYGEVKVTASISLACDQNEEAVNEAGKQAFLKAVDLVNEGMAVLTGAEEIEERNPQI